MATAEPLSLEEPTQLTARGAARTDVGRRRHHNEDQVLVADTLGLFVVADGMGGHEAGDVASAIVVASMEEYFWADAPVLSSPAGEGQPDGARRILSSVHYANREVYTSSDRSAHQGGMGSTVVALFVALQEQQVHICHVGDSRCYRYRDGQLTLLTEDHSMINEALKLNPNLSPEILKQLPSNVVTRALGTKELVEPEVRSEPLRADDLYLLCSDGLTGEVSDEDLAFALADTDDLADTCELLINMANDAGGRDNVSAVLVHIGAYPGAADGEQPSAHDDDAATALAARAVPHAERDTRPDAVPPLAPPQLDDSPAPASAAPAAAKRSDRRAERRREIAAATARLDAALEELASIEDWGPSGSDAPRAPAATPSGHLLIVPEPDEYDYDYDDDIESLDEADDIALELVAAKRLRGRPIIRIGDSERPAPLPVDDQVTRCLACGHALAPDERFCGMCGLDCHQMAYSLCDNCEKPLLEDTRYCVWCGSRVG